MELISYALQVFHELLPLVLVLLLQVFPGLDELAQLNSDKPRSF